MKKILKTLSLVTTIALLTEVIALATTSTGVQGLTNLNESTLNMNESPISINIPHEYGRIIDSHDGTNGKLIIHIQDAHSNFDAQMNIASIIKSLSKEHDIRLILSEGAEGNADLRQIRDVLALDEIQPSARRLLFNGLISGHEYINLIGKTETIIEGVESNELYDENVQSYADLYQFRKQNLKELHYIFDAIERVKAKVYPDALLDFEEKQSKAGSIDDLSSMRSLILLAERKQIDLNKYPLITHMIKAIGIEKQLDFNSLNLDLEKILSFFMAKDNANDLAAFREVFSKLKDPVVAVSAYKGIIRAMNNNGMKIADYPRFESYGVYIDYLSKISAEELLNEVTLLEDEVYVNYLKNENQQTLRAIDIYAQLLKKGCEVKMSPREYAEFKNMQNFHNNIAWIAFINTNLMALGYDEGLIKESNSLDKVTKKIHRFYELAHARDYEFIKNTDRILISKQDNKAFLIAGGYHSGRLKEMLKRRGYSYIVCTPHVLYETDHSQYEKILLSSLAEDSNRTKARVSNYALAARLASQSPIKRFRNYLKKPGLQESDSKLIKAIHWVFRINSDQNSSDVNYKNVKISIEGGNILTKKADVVVASVPLNIDETRGVGKFVYEKVLEERSFDLFREAKALQVSGDGSVSDSIVIDLPELEGGWEYVAYSVKRTRGDLIVYEDLYDSTLQILQAISTKKPNLSVAIPAFGTSHEEVTASMAANSQLKAVKDFIDGGGEISEITFVLFEEDVHQEYKRVFEEEIKNTNSRMANLDVAPSTYDDWEDINQILTNLGAPPARRLKFANESGIVGHKFIARVTDHTVNKKLIYVRIFDDNIDAPSILRGWEVQVKSAKTPLKLIPITRSNGENVIAHLPSLSHHLKNASGRNDNDKPRGFGLYRLGFKHWPETLLVTTFHRSERGFYGVLLFDAATGEEFSLNGSNGGGNLIGMQKEEVGIRSFEIEPYQDKQKETEHVAYEGAVFLRMEVEDQSDGWVADNFILEDLPGTVLRQKLDDLFWNQGIMGTADIRQYISYAGRFNPNSIPENEEKTLKLASRYLFFWDSDINDFAIKEFIAEYDLPITGNNHKESLIEAWDKLKQDIVDHLLNGVLKRSANQYYVHLSLETLSSYTDGPVQALQIYVNYLDDDNPATPRLPYEDVPDNDYFTYRHSWANIYDNSGARLSNYPLVNLPTINAIGDEVGDLSREDDVVSPTAEQFSDKDSAGRLAVRDVAPSTYDSWRELQQILTSLGVSEESQMSFHNQMYLGSNRFIARVTDDTVSDKLLYLRVFSGDPRYESWLSGWKVRRNESGEVILEAVSEHDDVDIAVLPGLEHQKRNTAEKNVGADAPRGFGLYRMGFEGWPEILLITVNSSDENWRDSIDFFDAATGKEFIIPSLGESSGESSSSLETDDKIRSFDIFPYKDEQFPNANYSGVVFLKLRYEPTTDGGLYEDLYLLEEKPGVALDQKLEYAFWMQQTDRVKRYQLEPHRFDDQGKNAEDFTSNNTLNLVARYNLPLGGDPVLINGVKVERQAEFSLDELRSEWSLFKRQIIREVVESWGDHSDIRGYYVHLDFDTVVNNPQEADPFLQEQLTISVDFFFDTDPHAGFLEETSFGSSIKASKIWGLSPNYLVSEDGVIVLTDVAEIPNNRRAASIDLIGSGAFSLISQDNAVTRSISKRVGIGQVEAEARQFVIDPEYILRNVPSGRFEEAALQLKEAIDRFKLLRGKEQTYFRFTSLPERFEDDLVPSEIKKDDSFEVVHLWGVDKDVNIRKGDVSVPIHVQEGNGYIIKLQALLKIGDLIAYTKSRGLSHNEARQTLTSLYRQVSDSIRELSNRQTEALRQYDPGYDYTEIAIQASRLADVDAILEYLSLTFRELATKA